MNRSRKGGWVGFLDKILTAISKYAYSLTSFVGHEIAAMATDEREVNSDQSNVSIITVIIIIVLVHAH